MIGTCRTGPSRGASGVQGRDWRNIGSGDGFYAFRDPSDPDLVFVEYQGGEISRMRLSTGESREIQPAPGDGEPDYRFNWNTPIHLSPNEPGTIYVGSQFLFRSQQLEKPGWRHVIEPQGVESAFFELRDVAARALARWERLALLVGSKGPVGHAAKANPLVVAGE